MAAEDIGALVVRIEANLRDFQNGINQVNDRVDSFGSRVKKIGGIIAGAFAVGAVVNFGKTMLMAASDAAEMQSKFDTVFGEMSETTEEWAKNFQASVGGSRVEIKSMLADSADLLGGFGATQEQAFDLSTRIQSLGTDIASFSNIQGGAEEAVDRLRKGLMGETENLKALGIVINQTMLQQELSSKGDTRKLKDLTELEKMELRYGIAVRQSQFAIGDAAKTSTGFANQIRNLKGQLTDVTARLGTLFLPTATKVITWINSQIPNMENIIFTAFENIKNAITPIYNTIMPLLQQGFQFFSDNILPIFSDKTKEISNIIIPDIINIFKKLYGEIMPLLQKIFKIFTNDVIPKFSNAFLHFVKNIYPIVVEAFDFIVDNILPPVIDIIEYLATEIVPLLAKKFQEWMPVVVNIIENLWTITKPIIDLIVAAFEFAWPYIRNIVSNTVKSLSIIIDGLLQTIKGITDFIIGIFSGNWERAWNGIKNIFTGIFSKIIKEALQIGINIAKGLIKGIDGMLGAVGNKAKELAASIGNAVKDFLGIKSPSRLMAEYGKFIAEGLALGIKENATKAERAAFKMAQDTVKTFDRLGNAIMDALRRRYDKEESMQLNALNKQTEAIRKNTDERIKQYNRELVARLKTIDNESSEELKAIQNQIDNINNLTEREEKELEAQEHAKRVSDLEKQISEAETSEERQKIQKELNNIIQDRERKLLLESRQDRIEALRNEMDDIRNQADEKKKRLEEEFQAKKENLQKREELILAGFQREITQTKEHFNILREEENMQAEARRLALQESNDELINLLETYNPKWQDAGQSFGESLLLGLNSTKQSIKDAVNEVFAVVNTAGTAYIVRTGDTLSKIASKFNTTVSEIAKLNKIIDVNLIQVGQKLKIPGFADGVQNFRGGMALVGEKGPELVNLPKGTDVIPNNQISNNANFEGMFKGAIFNVRNDNDIKLIAREIYNLQQNRSRGNGVVFGT